MHRIIARTARAARLHYTNYELWKPRVYMHMYTRVGGGAPWGVPTNLPTAAPVVGVVHFFSQESSVLHHSMALAVLRFLRGSLTANDHRLEATSQDDSRAARWRRFACEVNEGPPAPGLYKSCLQRAQAATTAESKITHRQIEKDLTRTFGALSG